MERDTIRISVIAGVEGPCLCFGNGTSGRRVAGPKPWGGGETVFDFSVSINEIHVAIEKHAYKKGNDNA